MYTNYDNLNDSRSNDSRTNDSLNSSQGRRRRCLDDYEFLVNENSRLKTSDLGKGSYGTVKKVKDKTNGKTYAMKIMNKKAIFEHSSKENLKREITIQKAIIHPNIIRLHAYFEDSENVYLVLEFAENGTLFHYLRRKKKFTEDEAFVYFFQTCLGIDYLHKRNVVHRDLKPENLLLDGEGNIKLCDFGWSADTSSKRQTFCGTIDYMAPEMIKNHPHDHRLDIWCLGILLYEMLHGYAPFKGRNDQEKFNNISKNTNIDFDPSISAEAIDLIRNILQPAPINRIPMSGIFKHSWMKKCERIYKIDVISFVQQQDEQLRECQKSENLNLLDRPESYLSKESGKIGKIITILDNDPPINISQKSTFEEDKKFSYNISTKASATSSTGSQMEHNSFKSDHLSKNHDPNIHMRTLFSKHEHSSNKKYGLETEPSPLLKSATLSSSHSRHDSFSVNTQKSPYTGDGFRRNDSSGYFRTNSPQKLNTIQEASSNSENFNIKRYDSSLLGSNNKAVRSHSSNARYITSASTQKSFKPGSYYYDEDDEIFDQQRLSRVSIRNGRKFRNDTKDGSGFFEKILISLGCISRGNPGK